MAMVEEFRNQRATEDWGSRGRFREELALEVSLTGGAEPVEAGEPVRCFQSRDQQQGNHSFSNEHSMCKEPGRKSARCVASGNRVLPLLKMCSSVLKRVFRKDGSLNR